MPGIRVGSLDLKLVAPAALQSGAAALRRGTEEVLIPAVLRAMERRLTQTHGERAVIRVRSIDIRLKLNPSDLASSQRAEALGEDIAEQLLGQATIETASARSRQAGAAVRIWRDARQLTAARLAAAALREVGPDDTKEAFDDLWRAVTRAGPADVVLVLRELADVQELLPVLDRLPVTTLATLSKSVAPLAPSAVVRAIDRVIARRKRTSEPASEPGPETETQALSEAATADAESGSSAPEAPHRRAGPGTAEDGAPHREALPKTGRQDEGDAQAISSAPDGEPPAQAAVPELASEGPAAGPPHDEATLRSREKPDASPDDIEVRQDLADAAPDPWSPASFPSDWCGLAYLLPIAIRAELPETLWQAGLDEGAAFCHALALIAGGGDDPSTRILSRRFPEAPPTLSRVADWAREEVATTALDRAVALGEDRAVLAERIALFHACLSVDDGSDLAAWLAAYLLAIFESSIDHVVEPGAYNLYFARPGRIEIEDDVIRIVQPLETIDIDIRRAGLDGDPGWLAWIGKRLVFVFESEEEA